MSETRKSFYEIILAQTPSLTASPGDSIDDDPEQRGALAACRCAIDAFGECVGIVIEGGHRDALPARAAALACLVGHFETTRQAASAMEVSHSTVVRALKKIREAFERTSLPF